MLAAALVAGADGFLDHVAAVLAFAVGNVEGEIVRAVGDGEVDEFEILRLAEVVVQIDVGCRAAIGKLVGLSAVENELVEHRGVVVGVVEVTVVEVLIGGYPISVGLVPVVVLAAQPLGRHYLAVEEDGPLAVVDGVTLVLLLDGAEDKLEKLDVLCVVGHLHTEEAGTLVEAVDTDGAVEFRHIDIATIGSGKHALVL